MSLAYLEYLCTREGIADEFEIIRLVEALMKGVDYPYLFEKVEYPTPPWRKRGGISV